jgi:cytochrome c oxidase assembly factor CtaG
MIDAPKKNRFSPLILSIFSLSGVWSTVLLSVFSTAISMDNSVREATIIERLISAYIVGSPIVILVIIISMLTYPLYKQYSTALRVATIFHSIIMGVSLLILALTIYSTFVIH